MTETEWLTCADPRPLLAFVKKRSSDRKLRLFAAVCCRRVWHLLAEEWSRQAVEIAESYADGLLSDAELKEANRKAGWAAGWAEQAEAAEAAAWASAGKRETDWVEIAADRASQAETLSTSKRQAQAELVRDIFGNPFRTVVMKPAWRTQRVLKLAETIYQGRAFDRMPELADVLKAARCNSPEMLSHCRGPGEHARGCWVVDLVLGKEAPSRIASLAE